MKTPRIVIVGHVCIDQNTTESVSYTSWGSSVLYIADYLHRAHNLQPTVITSYGPDMLEYVPAAIKLLPAQPNQPQTLRYENDTRSIPRIWRSFNTAFAVPPALDQTAITALNQADVVIVATLLPNYPADFISEVMRYARPDSLKLLCPQGYLRNVTAEGLVIPRTFDEAHDIVPLFDVVVFSEEDTPRAIAIAKTWKRLTPAAHIVVTNGPNGANIVSDKELLHVPTTPLAPLDIVDSVGCGDVFEAELIYAYYHSADLPQAVAEAHRAASRKLLGSPVH